MQSMASKTFFYIFTKIKNPLLEMNLILHTVRYPCISHLAPRPVYQKIHEYSDNIAIIDLNGAYTYRDILCYSNKLHERIVSVARKGLSKNISLLCPNDVSYVGCLIACWMSGNTVLPLCKDHPVPYLKYFVKDSQSDLIIVNRSLSESISPLIKELGVPVLEVDSHLPQKSGKCLSEVKSKNFIHDEDTKDRSAMILYTSGTTGPPKGVVLTFGNLCSQVSALVKSWGWSSNDTLLHALPLHHMHGIMNALLCPLDVGACVVMLPKFNEVSVWEHLLGIPDEFRRVNMFFAVPTMYNKLVAVFEEFTTSKKISKEFCKKICMEKIRLMTCGSSALPEPVFLKWEELTGHRLLERYGMSEIGMALSNPLNGPRIPGSVGVPLPDVSVCISKTDNCGQDFYVYAEDGNIECALDYKGEPGNLLVKGPAVFKMYWNKPDETKASFALDGWFKTGDTASYENGCFRILGRTSVDIIKSGGYKISALDLERVMLSHIDITDCSVIGVSDDTWGEKVVAFIVTKPGTEIQALELKTWCMEKLPRYSIPAMFKFVTEIPRNNMGKVNKKELKANFFG